MTASKFYGWRGRYGKVNEHNGWVPRDFWLEEWEKQAIIAFHLKNPLEGYRRLTFMMLDADIVAVSPASVWRVLSRAGLLRKWNGKPSKKGTGFEQPPQPHPGNGCSRPECCTGSRTSRKRSGRKHRYANAGMRSRREGRIVAPSRVMGDVRPTSSKSASSLLSSRREW